MQIRRNREDLASVRNFKIAVAVQFWSSLNVCLIFIAVISTAVTENVYEELGV